MITCIFPRSNATGQIATAKVYMCSHPHMFGIHGLHNEYIHYKKFWVGILVISESLPLQLSPLPYLHLLSPSQLPFLSIYSPVGIHFTIHLHQSPKLHQWVPRHPSP